MCCLHKREKVTRPPAALCEEGRSYAKQRQLTLLMEGRHPVTKDVIGTAHPLRI